MHDCMAGRAATRSERQHVMTLGCSFTKIIRKVKAGMLRYRDLNSEIPISISSFAHIEIGHRSTLPYVHNLRLTRYSRDSRRNLGEKTCCSSASFSFVLTATRVPVLFIFLAERCWLSSTLVCPHSTPKSRPYTGLPKRRYVGFRLAGSI